jgi:hypothetical protein
LQREKRSLNHNWSTDEDPLFMQSEDALWVLHISYVCVTPLETGMMSIELMRMSQLSEVLIHIGR